jgi:prolyl 4-hydroxylase
VINSALPILKEATVYNETIKADVVEDIRKCKVCYFNHNHDEVFSNLVKRLSEITGVSPSHAEKIQIVSYQEGEYFDYHVDAFTPDESPMFLDGHQRIITTMVYLNDVLEGGETSFKMLNLNINPVEGRLLVFQNCKKNTNLPNPQTLHAGMPIKKGVKYVMNVWYRETVRSEYLEEIKNDKNYLSADV